MAWVPPPEIAGNSLKIPPAWDPANEELYPFRAWLQDVTMWAAATELFPQQIGPSIALRVAGPARELLRDIPVQQLQQGAMVDRNDGNGPQQFTGFQLVTFVLSQRFAPLPEETSLRAVDDILQFRRRNNENIDQLITRFLSTRDRAAAQANFRMSPAGVSWMLMSSLGASSTEWTMLLQQNGGQLPNTEQGFDQLTAHIRRMGHVLERNHMAINRSDGSSRHHHFFPMWTDAASASPSAQSSGWGFGQTQQQQAPHPASQQYFPSASP